MSKQTSIRAQPTARQWLSIDGADVLAVKDAAQATLAALEPTTPVNLVSIFGAARQGKSFLMNMLAGQEDLFRISNRATWYRWRPSATWTAGRGSRPAAPWSASPMPSPPRAGAAGGDDGAAADAIVAPLMTANPWGRPASLEANPFGDPAVMPRDGAAAEPSAANPFGLAASSGANNPFAADDDQLRGTLANLSDAVFDSPVLGQHPEGGS